MSSAVAQSLGYFATVFDIWQLSYMTWRFFVLFNGINKCKQVNIDAVVPYAFIHAAQTLFIPVGSLWIPLSSRALDVRILMMFYPEGLHPRNECPGYDTKQSDSEIPVMPEVWGIQSNPLLPSLPGPLWLGVVTSDKGLSMG